MKIAWCYICGLRIYSLYSYAVPILICIVGGCWEINITLLSYVLPSWHRGFLKAYSQHTVDVSWGRNRFLQLGQRMARQSHSPKIYFSFDCSFNGQERITKFLNLNCRYFQ
jgi:hypothetical protein